MITVHHLENSRSQRVIWLLEELGLPYEVERYARNSKTLLAPPELKAVHPLGKSPVITDGGQVIAESGAIIEYLVEKHGGGRLIPPAGTLERLRYVYWLHYAEGSMMPLMVMTLVFGWLARPPMPMLIRPLARRIGNGVKEGWLKPQVQQHLQYMEAELSKQAWFAGAEFTAADIQMSFPLEAAAARGGMDARYPRLTAFLETIHARPAYQRALARGGPYKLLS